MHKDRMKNTWGHTPAHNKPCSKLLKKQLARAGSARIRGKAMGVYITTERGGWRMEKDVKTRGENIGAADRNF